MRIRNLEKIGAVPRRRREQRRCRCRSSRPARRAPGFPRTAPRGGAASRWAAISSSSRSGRKPSRASRQLPAHRRGRWRSAAPSARRSSIRARRCALACGARRDRSDAGPTVVRPASASRTRARARRSRSASRVVAIRPAARRLASERELGAGKRAGLAARRERAVETLDGLGARAARSRCPPRPSRLPARRARPDRAGRI